MGAVESIRYSAFKKANMTHEMFGEPLITRRLQQVLLCNKDLPEDGYVRDLKEATLRLKERGDIKAAILDFFSFTVSAKTQD